MRLSEKQADFLLDMAYLVQHINAFDAGRYYCTAGDYYRDPRVHGKQGEKKSYSAGTSGHKNRLAADLNIYFDGKYLEDTEDYKPFGDYWKALNDENRWGGDFDYDRDGQGDDGNHFSRSHWGIE